MKTKFSRILGIALTLAMVASLFVFAVPVAAQPGETTWETQAIPTVTGNVILDLSDVGDIAVSNDGIIYAINNDPAVNANVAGSVLRSADGGQSFSACANVAGNAGFFMTAIAVAPDDSGVVIVSDGRNCFISSDAGTTWTQLGSVVAGAADRILDVDVSPAIPGALFGRHYVRAVANNTWAVHAARGTQIIGVEATNWVPITTGAAACDVLSVKFSPSYMGDRALGTVYNTGATTFFDIISQPGVAVGEAQTQTCNMGVVWTNYESEDIAGQPWVDALVVADIALPSNWDPSLTAGQVSYVGLGSATAPSWGAGVAERGGDVALTGGTVPDDVYRIDANVANDLNGSNQIPVHSVAYDGTIDDGTLYLGRRLEPTVRYTANPTSMSPTWKTTQKAPTGDNLGTGAEEACTKIVVAPNGNIYAGTRDSWTTAGAAQDRRSAFSVSTDAGITFNQTAIIDLAVAGNDVDTIDSVMLTPDGTTLFMGTDDGIDLSLWKSATPTGSDTWERIYCQTAAGPGLVRLAPDYADNPSVFWANTAAANLWVSHDGGAVFSNRIPPAITQDMTVESGGSSGVVYMSRVASANIYKSANGGYWFGLPVDGEANNVISLAMAPSYPALPVAGNLLVGGTGAVSYSTDSAASFTTIDGGLAGASTFQVCADEGYADNNFVYCGDSLAAGTANTFRFEIGVSTAWDDMLSAAPAGSEVVGLGINNGVLYSLSDAIWGVERTLYPLDPLGLIGWDTGNTGLVAPSALAVAGSPNILTVADNFLYMPDRTVFTPVLWALQDTMATVVPVTFTPAEGTAIAIDPVTGWGVLTTVAWAAIGSGGGMVDTFEVWADQPSVGWLGVGSLGAAVVGNATIPSLTVGFGGTGVNITWGASEEYMIRVRCRSTINNGGLRSHWSDVINVSIQAGLRVTAPHVGPQLLGPTGGATDVSLNPGFSWAPIFDASEYEFILATNATLTDTVEGTPVYVTQPSWQVPAGTLEYDTQYFWGVKATEPTESPQSIGTFRTIAPAEYICPFCGEIFTTAGALDSHIAAVHPAATPAYIWAIIVIGAVLMIAVIMLILKTRRVA